MNKKAKSTLIQKFISWMGRVTNFPVVVPYGIARISKNEKGETRIEPLTQQICSGGYNEAFVFENWASYGPRH